MFNMSIPEVSYFVIGSKPIFATIKGLPKQRLDSTRRVAFLAWMM